jgi:hypothetical protein
MACSAYLRSARFAASIAGGGITGSRREPRINDDSRYHSFRHSLKGATMSAIMFPDLWEEIKPRL